MVKIVKRADLCTVWLLKIFYIFNMVLIIKTNLLSFVKIFTFKGSILSHDMIELNFF